MFFLTFSLTLKNVGLCVKALRYYQGTYPVYQGTAVEISILTRKRFGVLFPGDHDWRPMIFMYLPYLSCFCPVSMVTE